MSVGAEKVRWKFTNEETDEAAYLPYNPNTMSSPTTARNMTWAWGSKFGLDRMRGFDAPPAQPTQWTFGGVILTKEHYDLLLDWAGSLAVIRVDDHLGRTFRIVISQYDPVEKLPTPKRAWRATYTMTCLLLERVA